MNTPLYWHLEHTNIGRLLDFLARQQRVFEAGEAPQYDLVLNVVSYLRHFSDRYHHARENVAFAYLVQRDHALRTTTERLLQEHLTMGAKADELCTLLADAVAGDGDHRTRVEASLAPYLTCYRNHVATEEQNILPRAAEVLTAEEWMSVASAAPPGPDPFRNYGARRHNPTFGREAEARYHELLKQISIGYSTQSSAPAFRRLDERHEIRPSYEKKFAASPAVPPRKYPVVRSASADWRPLVRPTVMLLALVLAYLQYYFIDVELQISLLPSIRVFLPPLS